jgi:hypothetical protein
MGYTFGDNQEASRRLRLLAEVYEPETRDLLNAVRSECSRARFELALDLGCGPGWSTRQIELTLSPKRIIGQPVDTADRDMIKPVVNSIAIFASLFVALLDGYAWAATSHRHCSSVLTRVYPPGWSSPLRAELPSLPAHPDLLYDCPASSPGRLWRSHLQF